MKSWRLQVTNALSVDLNNVTVQQYVGLADRSESRADLRSPARGTFATPALATRRRRPGRIHSLGALQVTPPFCHQFAYP